MARGVPPRKARVGATTLAVTVAAVAVLEVLQRMIGEFDLRPWVNVLLVVAVALATPALSVLRQRRQREQLLGEALRSWPLPKMAEIDRYRLGVFPLRREAEGTADADYVSRGDVDARLRGALESASFVLVFGPPRAGKSRTALEAAKEVLGDALVIIPRNAEGLRELLTLDPPLLSRDSPAPRWSRSSRAVLWLDGLARYFDVLDANVLEQLQGEAVPLTVIATIREDEYDAVLAGSGPEAEAVKAVVATAQAFELAAGGPAAQLSSSGKEAVPPPARDERSAGEGDRAIGDLRFAVPAALSLAAVAAIGLIGLTAGFREPAPLTLAEQADRRLVAAGAQVYGPTRADLHGSGEESWIFVVAPRAEAAAGAAAPSHEIRIYDPRGDRLVERFRFAPDAPGAQFQFRDLARLGAGGGVKLVGGYGFPGEASLALLPFIVYWHADTGSYRIEALQDERPQLGPGVTAEPAARPYLDAYRERITLRDSDRGVAISGHRVQDFAVTRDPPRVVSGVTFDPRTASRPGRVEIQGSILSFTGPEPALIGCRFQDARALTGPWTPGKLLWRELRERWDDYLETRDCIPAA
jgi:hypothetical protein